MGQGRPDFLCIARGVGHLNGLGRFHHQAIVLTQGGGGLFAFGRLAIEGVVNGFSESVPQFLLELAVQGHALRLNRPALLQGAHRVNPQIDRSAQNLGFFDQGVAQCHAGFLRRFNGGSGSGHGLFPQALHFGKGFLAQMPGIAPTLCKLVQAAVDGLPVGRAGLLLGLGPGLQFFDDGQALGLVFNRLGFDFLQPRFDHFVGLVAGFVKALPQGVIGRATLVGLFPLLAQGAQGLLHFAAPQGLTFGPVHEGFRPLHQGLTHLIGAPALPTFQFPRRHQSGVDLVLHRSIDQFTVVFERMAQSRSRASTGLAMAFGGFTLEFGQGFGHNFLGFLSQLRRHGGARNPGWPF